MPVDLAVIPVAGHGTRLLPATKCQPKEMLPVGRKPVVQFVVEELAQSGIRRALFITGRGKTSLEDHLTPNKDLINYLRSTGREEELATLEFERLGLDYCYTRQSEQLGLGHAILEAEAMVQQQPFVVALGDSIIGVNANSRIVEKMIAEFERTGADCVVAFEEVDREDVIRYGIAQPKGNPGEVFELLDLVEKPNVDEAPSTLAVAARYVFNARIFEKLKTTRPGKGGEIQLTDAIRAVLKDGGKGIGVRLPAEEQRFDIGNYKSYFRAFLEFALADPDFGDDVRATMQELLSRRGQ